MSFPSKQVKYTPLVQTSQVKLSATQLVKSIFVHKQLPNLDLVILHDKYDTFAVFIKLYTTTRKYFVYTMR